jgi:hypothetical protein
MGSMINRSLAKLQREQRNGAQTQKVLLPTEDVEIDAMIASGAAGADDFFIVIDREGPGTKIENHWISGSAD